MRSIILILSVAVAFCYAVPMTKDFLDIKFDTMPEFIPDEVVAGNLISYLFYLVY